MSNPMLRADRFGSGAAPPETWPGGARPGWGSPGHGQPPPVPPAPDTVSPWPPAGSGTEETLRRGGVASATAVLLAIIVATGLVGWNVVDVATSTNAAGKTVTESVSIPPWIFGAVIVGFVLAIITFVKPNLARITGPLYAVAEGLFIGAISKVYEAQYTGIVLQAVGLTIGVFLLMLMLFATGRIRVTPKLTAGIAVATGAVFLVYAASFVLSLFGSGVPYIHDSGPIGIGFSVVVVGIAAFNLLIDFDFIDRAEAAGAPRRMEWYAAFSLVVTLVWLYLELLRLLGKLRSR